MISNTMLSVLVKYQWIQPTSQSLPLQRGWWFDFQTSLVLINTCLFWSLHIEISLLIISGQGMEGSRLDEIMSKCGLSTVRADSLVAVNDLKKSRVLSPSRCECDLLEINASTHWQWWIDFLWFVNKTKMNEMCFCWKLILELMTELLAFIRSLPEGKYPLYIALPCDNSSYGDKICRCW